MHDCSAGCRYALTMRSLALLFCLASILPAVAQPNVILIVSDDQGWPDLGCIGSKPVITPNLDRLAAQGVRATSFYVTWPACTPSRGSILTGRYPQRNGLYDMVRNDMVNFGHRYGTEEYAVSPEMTLGLDVREKTIGDMLKPAGFACGVVGKWDMGQARRYLPLQRGFDSFYGHGNNGIDYYTHERYGVPSLFRGNARTEEDKGTYVTDVFKREALRFVGEHAGRKPFFLYLPFNAPHGASSFGEGTVAGKKKIAEGVQAPEKYVAMYRGKVKDERLARYYGAVTCMDEAIGALMALLDAKKLTDSTLVMFLSDNGGSGNGGNEPLRGAKSSMWEGGLRVPFIARWPGKIPAGKVTHEFLTSLELVPTILAATGAKAPDGVKLDGFDMLPVLRGEMESPRKEMFWQRRGDKAARIENWKWLESQKGSGLYDVSDDISEKKDLSQEKPEVLKMMRDKFDAWRAEMDATAPRGPFRDY
jgi:arylsulfatase A-like enzyme